MVVDGRQSFLFFRQISWFLGNNRVLSEFRYQNLGIRENQFYINHASYIKKYS